MKNAINYYYNLYPEVIRQINNYFLFSINNDKYYLVPYERSINEIRDIFSLHQELIRRNILIHEIILNKDKQPLTYVNNIPYILMKVYVNDIKMGNLSDIHDIAFKSIGATYGPTLSRINWFQLWTNKVDYLEYQISEFGKKYSLLSDSISYYIGMAENAISYIKNTTIETRPTPVDAFVVSHRRIDKNTTLFDFYNPLNLIIDHKARDVSEYIKTSFFNNKNIWPELYEYFSHNLFSEYGLRLLFGRLLYPSYYFDLFEQIIDQKIKEEEIIPIINKISDYEKYLNDIYNFLNTIAFIPKVEWLIKK
jgi:spore coat protein YutH